MTTIDSILTRVATLPNVDEVSLREAKGAPHLCVVRINVPDSGSTLLVAKTVIDEARPAGVEIVVEPFDPPVLRRSVRRGETTLQRLALWLVEKAFPDCELTRTVKLGPARTLEAE